MGCQVDYTVCKHVELRHSVNRTLLSVKLNFHRLISAQVRGYVSVKYFQENFELLLFEKRAHEEDQPEDSLQAVWESGMRGQHPPCGALRGHPACSSSPF